MRIQAVGDGPVNFLTSDGRQLCIPLAAIYFETDKVKSTVTDAGLQEWLTYLAAQGRLAPASPASSPVTTSSPKGMVFAAATAGTIGNGIVVAVRALGAQAVEITVTETHVYEGLTFKGGDKKNIASVLAESAGGPLNALAQLAADTVPAAGVVPQDAPPTDPPTWTIKAPPAGGGAADKVTLQPRGGKMAKGTMTIVVEDVDQNADPKTFTLAVDWSNSVTVQVSDLTKPLDEAPLGDLGFAVTVKAPDGGSLALPRPGTYTLVGGAEEVPERPAKPASAIFPPNG